MSNSGTISNEGVPLRISLLAIAAAKTARKKANGRMERGRMTNPRL
jgi:hypothetical protein